MVRAPAHGEGLRIEFCEFRDTRQSLQLPRQSSDSESLEIQRITGHLECIRGAGNLSQVLLCSAWIDALLPGSHPPAIRGNLQTASPRQSRIMAGGGPAA